MGSRIARRLVGEGHEVVVWNRTPKQIAGAETAGSPAEAARRVEALIVMVSDPKALGAVVDGPEGVTAGPTSR
jgi:3-hydroxyisobutyrate dehydrogenase-like beta-hydroxyacid dehydrogenase